MNIQEMVDRRIEELRAQALASEDGTAALKSGNSSGPERPVAGCEGGNGDRPRAALPELSAPAIDDYGEFVDTALARLASRILEISEKLACDYARMEQEMLKARLAALQNVEMVLDIVLSIRREARDISCLRADELLRQKMQSIRKPGAGAYSSTAIAADPEDFDGGRASMHENGVAALFQRTQ